MGGGCALRFCALFFFVDWYCTVELSIGMFSLCVMCVYVCVVVCFSVFFSVVIDGQLFVLDFCCCLVGRSYPRFYCPVWSSVPFDYALDFVWKPAKKYWALLQQQ